MKKKKIKRKQVLYLFLFLLGIYCSYYYIEKKKVVLYNQEIIDFVFHNTFQKESVIQKMNHFYSYEKNKISLLHKDYEEVTSQVENQYLEPLIYLYNTHPTEEYQSSTIGEFSLVPNVLINNYILEDIFRKNGLETYVEGRLVSDVLEENNWNYASSYLASRMFLEDAVAKYPSLKYFIDIHRDSVSKDKTTIQIEGRDYAKILFIIGLENENYQDNLEFTEKIDQKINEYYPGLSKGIYKKEGPGVNGVYNQDFSPKTILVEMGGNENNTTEVLNTAIAFSKCMIEVIHEEN